MVFKDLLHGIGQHGDGNSRRVAGLPRIYLLHGHPHLRPLSRPSTTGESQEEFKVKYIKARIAEVTSDGEKLIVKGEDTLVKRPITIPFDLVVHAIGMDPNVDNKNIASVFGVDLEPNGFIDHRSSYNAMGLTARDGVFVAGSATGPETIDDSIAQAKAAAMAALEQRHLAARLFG